MSWAYLTRVSSAADLLEEIGDGEIIAEGVVHAEAEGAFAFARQAMRVFGEGPAEVDVLVPRLKSLLKKRLSVRPRRWALQIVAPDCRSPKDLRRRKAVALQETLPEALRPRLPPELLDRWVDAEEAERLLQVWVVEPDHAIFGLTEVDRALSRQPGGKTELRHAEDAVSRSALKLEEAIAWIGVGPEKGELVADLGASPGGWTQVASRRGATVIAVDPAKMKVDLPKKRFAHAQQSAFTYSPPETLDWVLCDMAWRPFEVAELLAKWARRSWARQIIANIKLPMKQKADMLARVMATLEAAGWLGLRARQLFHDRDEITLYGYLDPKLVQRGLLAPHHRSQKALKAKADAEAPARKAAGAKPKSKTKKGEGKMTDGPGRKKNPRKKQAKKGTKANPLPSTKDPFAPKKR